MSGFFYLYFDGASSKWQIGLSTYPSNYKINFYWEGSKFFILIESKRLITSSTSVGENLTLNDS